MRARKSIVMFIVVSFFTITSMANALTLSELIEKPLHSPFTVVSSVYDPHMNHIIMDMKILNIPEEMPLVDIYLFFQRTHSNIPQIPHARNPFIDIINPPEDEGETPAPDKVFLSLGLLGLTASPELVPFVQSIDFPSFGVKDLPVPGFVVDATILPNIKHDRYVLVLALVDSTTDEVVAHSRDLLELIGDFEPGP
ncbi:MAG: hypothetical protein HQK66_06295, partial [Desulfamplus sp.]|nr:hypothetical protein [Desulfamplus sp.]